MRFGGAGALLAAVYSREELPGGARLRGPAVIEELDSTTLVLPGQDLQVLENGIMRIGITHAVDLQWRFCDASSAHVSRPWPPAMRGLSQAAR